MDIDKRIAAVVAFRDALESYNKESTQELRKWINQRAHGVRREVIEAGCFQTYTVSPPPAVGGLLMRNVDLFDVIFDPPYHMSVIGMLIDTIDRTVGVMSAPGFGDVQSKADAEPAPEAFEKGYVFIAMPMAAGRPEYDDVQDAIKQAADNCGLRAERVDEIESNDRITDRLLESIRRAEFVVVDLTDARPNVFYEAGYAHGLGKTPVYVARSDTNIEFDLKDYPVIFFESMRQLREGLEKRLRAIAAAD